MSRARESTLKYDLQTLRTAIDKYTDDRHRPPESLHDLVDSHYIREIPVDPFTRQRDWVVHLAANTPANNIHVAGIDDVHSNSAKLGLDGNPYNTW